MTNSNVGGNDHNSRIVIAALYKFVPLADCPELREQLLQRCSDAGIKGSLLLASEGINGTIAGTREGIDAVLGWLRLDPRFADISHKESYADDPPFKRMKVKLKREIVTMGFPGITEAGPGGEHADWRTWNALVRDPDVVVVDTRNQYEFDVGTFAGAVSPRTDSFREFPDYVRHNLDPTTHKTVAMFCTGGIRCEKASTYMLQQGFARVVQLDGGILKYLEQVPAGENLWQGECFVFDERVSVDDALKPGHFALCTVCGDPVADATNGAHRCASCEVASAQASPGPVPA